jgi:ABC-type proline/glycine betaine transport system permease subunit
MSDIVDGMLEAFRLIFSLNADLLEIILLSLQVTLTAVLIASIIGMPIGAWLAINRFRYRRTSIALLNALMGLPPVVVGLIVYILLSRSGPFGVLNLLFTPTAMIIAQVIIITPLIASISQQANREEAESIDLETIDEDSDLSIFMKEGVPEFIKRQALSMLWKSSPVFANIDGLNDYDEDFGSDSLIMKTFKSAYKVGSGYAKELQLEDDVVVEEAMAGSTESIVNGEFTDENLQEEPLEEVLVEDSTEPELTDDHEQPQELMVDVSQDEASEAILVQELDDEDAVEEKPIKKVSLRSRLALDG